MSGQKTILKPCDRPTYASILLGPEKFEEVSKGDTKPFSMRQTPQIRQVLGEKLLETENTRKSDLNNNNNNCSQKLTKDELQHSVGNEILRRSSNAAVSNRSKHEQMSDLHSVSLKEPSPNNTAANESRDSISLKSKRSPVDYPGKRLKLDQGSEGTRKKQSNEYSPVDERVEKETSVIDNDGWQTRKSNSRRTRNENKAPQSYRQQNLQPARGGYQGSRSSGSNLGLKDAPKFSPWNRGGRAEGRRSTVFYPTNRGGNRQGRGQGSASSFGRPTTERSYSATDRMTEKSKYRSDKTDSPLNSFNSVPMSLSGEKMREKRLDVPTPTITAAATIIRRPDLTPPPPPSCGVFSYRDVLAKGLKPPPAPATYSRGSTPFSAPCTSAQSEASFCTSPSSSQTRSFSAQATCTASMSALSSPSTSVPLLSQSVSSAEAAHCTSISATSCSALAAPLSFSRPSSMSPVPAPDKASFSDSLRNSSPMSEKRNTVKPEVSEYCSKPGHARLLTSQSSTTDDDQVARNCKGSFEISYPGEILEPSKMQESMNVECITLLHQRIFEKGKMVNKDLSKEGHLADILREKEKESVIEKATKVDTESQKHPRASEKLENTEKTGKKDGIKTEKSPGKLENEVDFKIKEAAKISYSAAVKKSTSSDGSPKSSPKILTSEAKEGQILSAENEGFYVEEKLSSTPENNVSAREASWSRSDNSTEKADSTYKLNSSRADNLLLTSESVAGGASNSSSGHPSPQKVVNLIVDLDVNVETETQRESKLSVPPPTPTEESVNDPDWRGNASMGSLAVISSVAKELESQSTKLWLRSDDSTFTKNSDLEESHLSADTRGISSFSKATQSSSDPQTINDISVEDAEPQSATDYCTRTKKSETAGESTDLPGSDSSKSEGNVCSAEQLGDSFPGPSSQVGIPLVIKSVGKKEVFFPDIAQSWDSSNQNSDSETVLPQRSKQFRARNEGDRMSLVENSPDKLHKNGSRSEFKYDEDPAESERVQETSATNSSSSWMLTNMEASSGSYSSMATSNLARDEKSAEIVQSPRATVSSKIWTEESNEFGLPRTNILSAEKNQKLPLEILLNSQTSSSVLKQTEFYTHCSPTKQLNKFTASSVIESLPSHVVTKSVTCHSSTHNLDSFPKLPSVSSRQSDFGVNLTTVSKTIADASSASESTTLASEIVRSTASAAGAPSEQLPQNQPSYQPPQTSSATASTMNVPARSETEYLNMQRMTSVNMPPHLNYIQSHPPPPSLQYHSPYDPHWSRNFPLEMNQSEWLNVNRYTNPDRDFSRPPPLHSIHPVPQPMNYFNYPSPMQAQKDGIFPSYNYPPSPFQPTGYRFQTLPPFVQRPPPPLPSQFNSGLFGRPYDNRSGLPHRFSPEYRSQNNYSFSQKQYNDGDRMRVAPQVHSHYRDDVSSNAVPAYKATGTTTQPDNRFNSRDQRSGNRSIQPHHPQDPTLGDFLPRQLENYRGDKMTQDFGLSHSWKKSYDKKSFGNGRKNYKSEQKDEHYLQVGNAETVRDQEQPGDLRRKNQYKGPTNNDELSKHANKPSVDAKNNFQQADVAKARAERDLYGSGATSYQEKCPFPPYQQNSDVYLNHLMPTMMPPVELNFNAITSPYIDVNNDISGEKQASPAIVADYSTSNVEKVDYEEQTGPVNSLACDNIQDFCTGGWKYYNDAISSPSGLRIHQSTYVPYVNPCSAVPPAYLATDVRARVQWLGFAKAHEAYTARINSQRSLRMDVTVVCSKGSAVCCNSDILGTCSSYFYERLVGRTEEYITIFVNIPSKIMKHFLQMMSCGEAFVPMNDVNDVIMRAPVYLNLNP